MCPFKGHHAGFHPSFFLLLNTTRLSVTLLLQAPSFFHSRRISRPAPLPRDCPNHTYLIRPANKTPHPGVAEPRYQGQA